MGAAGNERSSRRRRGGAAELFGEWGEDGKWVAECPSLPGCVSQGETRNEAIDNIRDAIRVYVAVLEEDHLPILEQRFDTLLVAV
jgi:predicted RNase H-like HicB family nuclease